MNLDSCTKIRDWTRKQTGADPLFFWVWSAATAGFSVFGAIVSLAWWTILLAAAFVAGIALMNAAILRASAGNARLDPRRFLVWKKTASYFAFLQFCFHSIALIVAYGGERLGSAGYYAAYGVLAASSACYLPCFHALNAKKNLVKRGLLEEIRKNGKSKYKPVSLYRGAVPFVLSWVDAIVWACSAVIFVNSLIFQLYQIPSESMVPELYVGTRVFTVKTLTNPEVPLSLIRLPMVAGIGRFDQIVLNNPRYEAKKSRAIEEFFSNFVTMITFTLVKNPRLDDNGREIADPLIKRLIGLPGDQLLMADDVVYVRTAAAPSWEPLPGDEKFAYTLRSKREINLGRVQHRVFNDGEKAAMDAWDAEKTAIDAVGIGALFDELGASLNGRKPLPGIASAAPAMPVTAFRFDARAEITESALAAFLAWRSRDPAGFRSALAEFLGAWRSSPAPADLAAESALKTDLLFKLKFATMLSHYFESKSGIPGASYQNELYSLNRFTAFYVQKYFDARNFGPFPSGTATLGPGEYFLMGDNRYNSLDCRNWSETPDSRALYPSDPASIGYLSLAKPFAVRAEKIRGKAYFAVF